MTTILSIIALAASCVACTEDGPVTNPRLEETVAVGWNNIDDVV